jgi:molybdopterin/thiamine biosynthesis adenylyltransferase
MEEAEVIEKQNINPLTSRFNEAIWYNPNVSIVVGGVGGIGSYLSFLLARQEANLYLYDFDLIETHNLGGQLYKMKDIGKLKTQSIKDTIKEFSNSDNVTCLGKFEEGSMIGDIVFSGFDNMSARKLMFDAWKQNDSRKIFIDGRMLAEQGQIYCVIPGLEEEYEKTLFDDSEVTEQPCNYKATSYCGALIASLMVSCYNNYVTNEKLDAAVREVPFKMTYSLELLNFKIHES